jgi:ribosomal protein S18 acetylase RimI-like enzyme
MLELNNSNLPKKMNMNIVPLQSDRINQAVEVLTRAFDNDPMFSYVTPQEEKAKINSLQWLFSYFLDYVSSYQNIYTTSEELKGVIAWIPPESSKDNFFAISKEELSELNLKLGSSQAKRMISLFSKIEERHKIDMPQPHWYLYLLGVSSVYQGQKVGSSLIQPILKQADKDGFYCYVITFAESAVGFYQKHGFEVAWIGESSIGSPRIWTMKRKPT